MPHSSWLHISILHFCCGRLFSQNVIQLQPHGSKNPIVLYQEMWL